MRKTLLIFLVVLLLTSCATKEIYISPTLPEFSITAPERPLLLEVPETANIPKEVNINFDLMAGYAESLETIINSWKEFYSELCTIYQTN